MKAYLIVEKKHSGKKDSDYLSCAIVAGGKSYYVNLTYELLSVLLDLKVSEIIDLPVGYKSKQFEIVL